jgi:Zn-dependent protease with chaperone function
MNILEHLAVIDRLAASVGRDNYEYSMPGFGGAFNGTLPGMGWMSGEGQTEVSPTPLNSAVKRAALAALMFAVQEQDVDGLTQAMKSMAGEEDAAEAAAQRQNLASVSFAALSSAQRLLLMCYVVIYDEAAGRDTSADPRATSVLNALALQESFFGFVRRRLSSSGSILKDTAPVEVLWQLPGEMVEWATLLVALPSREGEFTKKRVLRGLDPKDYEHKLDKAALNALEGTPGLETLVKKFFQYGVERLVRVQYTGSNVKVTEKNFPALYRALKYCCDIIHLPLVPELYIMGGLDVNAMTIGVEKPIIVLQCGSVDFLTYDELLFVIGHEIGHIKSRHVLYHQMAQVLPYIGAVIGSATLGIGDLVAQGVQIALLNWQRKSEFTADRAGLLCCQNYDAAVTAMLKIAGFPPRFYNMIDPQPFLQQAAEFEGFDESTIDRVVKILSVMQANHPWTVMRGAEMGKWVDSGEYERILNKYAPPRATVALNPGSGSAVAALAGGGGFCSKCGNAIKAGDKFCKKCGNRIA